MNRHTAKIWVIYSLFLQVTLFVSVFFWDFFSGSDTVGFGVTSPYVGLPMFYVYMISLFTSYIVTSAILRSNYFGMGVLIWMPYATIGVGVEIYFEIIVDPVLRGYWAAFGYGTLGLLTGLSADITIKQFSAQIDMKLRHQAGLSGMVMSIVYFFGIVIALVFFYKQGNVVGSFDDPGSFLGVAYFGIPWMLIHGYIGGYLAGIQVELLQNENYIDISA